MTAMTNLNNIHQELNKRIPEMETDEIFEYLSKEQSYVNQQDKLKTEIQINEEKWRQKVQVALIENNYETETEEK